MANRKEDIKPVVSSNEEAVLLDKLRLEMLSSLEKYTRAMFKAQNKRTFVVNEHHRKIFEALQDVVDGKCTRLIINMPPRYSKCLHPSTRVLTERGLIPIGEVRRGDRVWSFKNGRAVLSTAQGTEPARKPSVKVTMRSGRSFVCSTDHPMLTMYGYREAGVLRAGDYIQALCGRLDTTFEMDEQQLSEVIFSTLAKDLTGDNPDTCLPPEVFSLSIRQRLVALGIIFYGCKKPVGIKSCYGVHTFSNRLALDIQQLMSTLGMASSVQPVEGGYYVSVDRVAPYRKTGLYGEYEDFYLDRVEKIEDVGVQDLVHLGVDDTHNFIANGLVSHNTEVVIKQFISWCFALNPTCMFLHLSYSDTLVNDNSSTIRQIMSEPLYKLLFPNSALEREKGATNKWKTKAGGELYAVSTQGQVTGFGAGKVDEPDAEIDDDTPFSEDEQLNQMLHAMEVNSNVFQGAMLIDDPLKPEDALSDMVRERINQRFENTIRNRVNSRNTPIIIIMQRLHEHDLCGYLMETEPDKWRVLSLPAILSDEDGNEKALWPLKHNIQELHDLRDADPIVFETQYMQNPTPKEGLMYDRGFSEYTPEELGAYKPNERKACNYTDTADTGADSLCSICFIDTPEFIYVTDVLYTTDPMEKTEPQTARMLDYNGTVEARIESNNGGRGFARKVQSLLKLTHKNFKCVVHWFHQSQNKYVRIYNNSATAMAIVKFPKGWERRWPKFHSALMSYRKENNKKNAHDDAPDCLTGCVEMKLQGTRKKKIRLKNG